MLRSAEGRAEQRDEQAVAARRLDAEDAAARRAARVAPLQQAHARDGAEDEGEEGERRRRPGHPEAAEQRLGPREPLRLLLADVAPALRLGVCRERHEQDGGKEQRRAHHIRAH